MEFTQEHTIQTQELLLRMERNYTIVRSLSKKINSYTCEPRDSSCFESHYNLKMSFKSFEANQYRLTQLLQSKSAKSHNIDVEIKQHLKRFNKLEQDIAAYLLENERYLQKSIQSA